MLSNYIYDKIIIILPLVKVSKLSQRHDFQFFYLKTIDIFFNQC